MNEKSDELRRQLGELSTDIQPERDLWPAVSSGMRENGANGGATHQATHGASHGATDGPAHLPSMAAARGRTAARPRHVPIAWAIAASAAFASIVGGAVWASMRAPATAPATVAGSTEAVESPIGQTVDPYTFASAGLAEYEAAAADLEEVIRAGQDLLDPATVTVLEQSLAAIDRAIDEAKAALTADPGHEGLRRMLQKNHRRKLGLLRQAAAAVQSST